MKAEAGLEVMEDTRENWPDRLKMGMRLASAIWGENVLTVVKERRLNGA